MNYKINKNLLLSITLIIFTLIGYVLFYRWDIAKNRGYEFGYYGVFNRIFHCLESIPDVSGITTTAMNIDISLEEFGLDVILKDERTIKLFFYYSLLDWNRDDYFPRGRTGMGIEG